MTAGFDLPLESFSGAPEDGRERRRRDRLPFKVLQRVAPCPDGKIPPASEFCHVRCHDISQSGIAFDTTRPPLDEFLVVALGDGKATLYVRARVANSMRITVGSTPMFRVGCEFVERIAANS